MPYITPGARERFGILDEVPPARSAGELNYVLTRLIGDFVQDQGLNYQSINDVVGALEGAKVEFQRRIVAPYEDGKIKANGDVYQSVLSFTTKRN